MNRDEFAEKFIEDYEFEVDNGSIEWLKEHKIYLEDLINDEKTTS